MPIFVHWCSLSVVCYCSWYICRGFLFFLSFLLRKLQIASDSNVLLLLCFTVMPQVVHMACAVSLQRQVPSFSADSNLFTSPDIAIWSTIPYSYTSSPASISPGRVTGLNGPASSNSGSSSSSSSTGVSSNGGGIAFPPSPAFGCATAVLVGEPASKRSLPDAEFGVQASNGKKSPSESITGSVDVSSRGVRRHFAKPSVSASSNCLFSCCICA